jgi:hypothetical protein
VSHEFQSNLRRWDVVAGLCQSIDAKTYVEVGCKEGRTTGFVLAQCPELRAIAIDPWCTQPAGDDASRETYEKWDFAEIERKFWDNVGSAGAGRCTMLRGTSEQAAKKGDHPSECDPTLRDFYIDNDCFGGLDVVFIDALHDYESVKQDIELWWPLVREGGYLAGHDYNHKWPGVMRAVAEHFNLMDVCLGPDSMWWVQKPVPYEAREVSK